MTAPAAPTSPYRLATTEQVATVSPAKTAKTWIWALAVLVVFLIVGLGGVVSASAGPSPAPACTGIGGCSRPPLAAPLSASEPYSSAAFGYSLDQQSSCESFRQESVRDDRSIGWVIDSGRWPVTFTAERAGGRTGAAIVDALQRARIPEARFLFSIPGAQIGYTPGEGRVYDYLVTSGSGQSLRARAILMVSVKRDVAIELVSVGPYRQNSKENYPFPNPQETRIGECFGSIANTVVWPGDPPL